MFHHQLLLRVINWTYQRLETHPTLQRLSTVRRTHKIAVVQATPIFLWRSWFKPETFSSGLLLASCLFEVLSFVGQERNWQGCLSPNCTLRSTRTEKKKKKKNLKTNRKWSDKRTVLFYKCTITATLDHTSALFIHSARLIAHWSADSTLRGGEDESAVTGESWKELSGSTGEIRLFGDEGFVKKLAGQTPASSFVIQTCWMWFWVLRCRRDFDTGASKHWRKGETRRDTQKGLTGGGECNRCGRAPF